MKLSAIVPVVDSVQVPTAVLAPFVLRIQGVVLLKPEPDTCTNMPVPEVGERTICGVTWKVGGVAGVSLPGVPVTVIG